MDSHPPHSRCRIRSVKKHPCGKRRDETDQPAGSGRWTVSGSSRAMLVVTNISPGRLYALTISLSDSCAHRGLTLPSPDGLNGSCVLCHLNSLRRGRLSHLRSGWRLGPAGNWWGGDWCRDGAGRQRCHVPGVLAYGSFYLSAGGKACEADVVSMGVIVIQSGGKARPVWTGKPAFREIGFCSGHGLDILAVRRIMQRAAPWF